ncbi:MFS transporter [Aeoliella mucimassa]|uniref:Inner membrane protein YihN n=1 Tax=Aeoliella mucimassa TaxID=2527972 RepID=A0A518AHL5_9BACT|nr:MFS transporter [Aeoliella mucimassa]QDU54219.1 Inner membrane protein YihN [Aeoliella mucimassa]
MSSEPTQSGTPVLSPARRAAVLTTLIVAGESIFFLPFLLPRTFRPTLLEVFELTNLQLGTAQAAYGIVAVVAYALGGPLADVFKPRTQMAIALATTALGGAMLWQIPSLTSLKVLYAYWGFTTIALFWAALMKATRELGGKMSQGTAFGVLDGGRGLLAVAISTVLVWVYASLLPSDVAAATLAERTLAFQWVIGITATCCLLAGLLVLVVIPKQMTAENDTVSEGTLAERMEQARLGIARVLAMPSVWLQAAIIVAAYAAFKATADFSLYATQVLGADEVQAAKLYNLSLWMRPIAAIGFGVLADRLKASYLVIVCFALVLFGSIGLAGQAWGADTYTLFMVNVISVSIGAYALRGLYFAIMEEAKIPLLLTGRAVGLASVVGYTPEIFMAPFIGYLTDSWPGRVGHHYVYLSVMAFALLGIVAGVLFRRVVAPRAG